MASRSGMFLPAEARQSLIQELKVKGELEKAIIPLLSDEANKGDTTTNKTTTNDGWVDFGTGCLACEEDDDHANLLLCEGCNDEYHTYCLDPPLRAVPAGDWFCAKCQRRGADPSCFVDDGLDRLVCALQPKFTSRFGEVCWAQGGVGFGWWPSFIYDPRLTVGSARQLARKNLGKRHLVYFFECHEAPFAVLPTSKIIKWEMGLLEDYHLGKTAKASGRARGQTFQQALQVATMELGKPVELRMDWNHTTAPLGAVTAVAASSSSPIAERNNATTTNNDATFASGVNRKGRKKRQRSSTAAPAAAANASSSTIEGETQSDGNNKRPQRRGFDFLSSSTNSPDLYQTSVTTNLTKTLKALTNKRVSTPVESDNDEELFCKLLKRVDGLSSSEQPSRHSPSSSSPSTSSLSPPMNEWVAVNVGFVKLPSRKTCTFADARTIIQSELVPDCIPADSEWKFWVPTLGPVSSKQEVTLGPLWSFCQSTMNITTSSTTAITTTTTESSNTQDSKGLGTIQRPLELLFVDNSCISLNTVVKMDTA